MTLRNAFTAVRYNVRLLPYHAFNLLCWVIVRGTPVREVADFAVARAVQEHAAEIVDEFREVVPSTTDMPVLHEWAPTQRHLSADGMWRMICLRLAGNDALANHELFPRTTRVLAEVPGVYSALFSCLDPDKVLPIHVGWARGVLRLHLPIIVPPGDLGMRVGRTSCTWTEGEVLVFDDTYPHRAWNRSGAPRVVLIVDFVRPMPYRWLERMNERVLAGIGRLPAVRESIELSDALVTTQAAAYAARGR